MGFQLGHACPGSASEGGHSTCLALVKQPAQNAMGGQVDAERERYQEQSEKGVWGHPFLGFGVAHAVHIVDVDGQVGVGGRSRGSGHAEVADGQQGPGEEGPPCQGAAVVA